MPFVVVLLLWAQAAPDTRQTLAGKVTAQGQPIPGAVVAARGVSTATDENGAFVLSGVPAGAVEISVQMFGFEPLRKGIAPEERAAGPVELVLQLRRAGVAPPPEETPVEPEPIKPPPLTDPQESDAALLVQGSLSRGLDGSEPAPDFSGASLKSEMRDTILAGRTRGEESGGPPTAAGRARLGRGAPGPKGKIGRRGEKPPKRGATTQAAFGNRTRKARSQIRGSFSYTARNSAFDAAPFAVNGQSLTKPSYAQNRYSLTFGGPLFIPKLIEDARTTLTLSYSGQRNRNPFTSFSTLPLANERIGDFSANQRNAALYDPTTAAPFPGNRIPASRFSAISRGLLPLIPQANQPGLIQNFRIVSSVPQDNDTLSLSVGRAVSRRDRLTFQTSLQSRTGLNIQPYGFEDPTRGSGRNFDLRWNHTFSPRVIFTSHARYNLSRNEAIPFFANRRDVSGELGITGNSRDPINWGPPNLNFTNFGDLTDAAHSDRRIHSWTYGGGVTIVRGRVTVNTGSELVRSQWNTFAEQNARGTLFFGGLLTSGRFNGFPQPNTGLDFADFLLGLPQQASLRAGAADTYLRSTQLSSYLQTEIRARRNLTFSLGARHEVWRPFTEKYGRMVNLDLNPELTRVEPVLPGANGPFSGAFPNGLIDTDWNNVSPRIGIAWRPRQKMRTRAGYGIYMDGTAMARMPTRLAAQPPFAATANFNTSPGALLTLANPFTGSREQRVRNTYAVDRHYLIPYAQSWNAGIEMDLPHHFVLDLGYLGTKGTRLVMQRLPNRAAPGSPTDSEQRRRIENAIGFNYDSTEGNSIFHAAQVRFQRRYARGLSWTANYTFGRSIDNATSVGGSGNVVVQDDRNFAAERGLSNFDRRHNLTFQSMVMSPFGRNAYFLKDGNRPVTKLLQDWALTIQTTARSGNPLTARVSGNVADAAGTGATGSGRASATGLPIRTGDGYFNTSAFAIPLPGAFGNAGRNTIPGQPFVTASLSLGRSFRVGDSARRRLDLRVEAENALNQTNITGLGVVINAFEYGRATRAAEMRNLNFTARFRF